MSTVDELKALPVAAVVTDCERADRWVRNLAGECCERYPTGIDF